MKRIDLARWCGLAAACAAIAACATGAPGAPAPSAKPAPGSAPAVARIVELVRKPSLVFGPAIAGLDAAAHAVDGSSVAGAHGSIDSAHKTLVEASGALGRGDVCGAAALASQADAAATVTEDALAAEMPAPSEAPGNLTELGRLGLHVALAQENLRPVHDAAATAKQICDSMTGPFERRAHIDRVEDQRGVALLDDGTIVALAPGGLHRAFAGRDADIRGVRFADGTVLASRIDSDVDAGGATAQPKLPGAPHALSTGSGGIVVVGNPPPPVYQPPCLILQAVPIQSGYPYNGGTVWNVQHALDGYTDTTGTLQFEVGLGLTPKQSTSTYYCPTWDTATGRSIIYSVNIVQHTVYGDYTLASDFHDSDGVVFPVGTTSPSSVTASYYQRECKWFAGITTCTTPVLLRSEQYPINVAPQGAFAAVQLDNTVFGVVP
jgi:hypothetical protein